MSNFRTVNLESNGEYEIEHISISQKIYIILNILHSMFR